VKTNKPSIVGLRDTCTCGSGRAYGACCFRLELAYIVIGLIPAVILFVFQDHLRVLFVPVLLVTALVAWLARRHFKRTGRGGNRL